MKTKKKKIVSIARLKNNVQKQFNRYIRERDKGQPCIACGQKIVEGSENAGHYFGTRSFNHMRFLEDNVHVECKGCNGFRHESLIYYTLNLPNKIGNRRFNRLVKLSKEKMGEFSRWELNRLLIEYTNKKPIKDENNTELLKEMENIIHYRTDINDVF